MILAVGNDSQFRDFCDACDNSELKLDERFTTNPGRVQNREQLVPIVESILKTRSTNEWITIFESAGVPCGPINNIEQVFDNEQVKSRELHQQLPHETCGTVPTVTNPIRYKNNQLSCNAAPPVLGQHTDTILQDLNISTEEIAVLREKGVIS